MGKKGRPRMCAGRVRLPHSLLGRRSGAACAIARMWCVNPRRLALWGVYDGFWRGPGHGKR
jgi:hypothetical protein